jgi:hypothetical protein
VSERGRHFLDRAVIEKISIGSRTLKIYQPGDGECSDAWVWTYLAACLATFLGYDDAREVVRVVKYAGVSL